MRIGWTTGLVLAVCGGCTGPEQTITVLKPNMVVLPESLDFGEVVVGELSAQDLIITNTGRASLNISDASLLDGSAGAIQFALDPVEVLEDESITVTVRFAPVDYEVFTDTLVITSDDEESPAEIPLTGLGVGPDIELDTLTLDFGDVAAGETATEFLTVSNVGGTELVIGQTELTNSGAFSVSPSLDDLQISPDFPASTLVTYSPADENGDTAYLTIPSNDPDENPVTVTLIGNGGGDGSAPVAVLDCPADVSPGETVHFDASGSYDPGGALPLTCEWSLTDLPLGSSAVLDRTDCTADLPTDVVGTYTVSVTVTNADGVPSAPAKCQISTIPADDIYVELVWDQPDADLDLHLATSDGSFYETPGDVSYCNDTPDWGVVDVDEDDPIWGGDDEDGLGPEQISIPSPVDDEYVVRVHYFEDEGGDETWATVRFYIRGELTEETRLVLVRNQVWDVGIIRWPYGYVVLYEEPEPTAAENRSCWSE